MRSAACRLDSLYNADVEAMGDPEPVAALKTAIREADALLIVTAEYNFGVPAAGGPARVDAAPARRRAVSAGYL